MKYRKFEVIRKMENVETREITETEAGTATFREMMELLEDAEPSKEPIPENGCETIYWQYDANEGTEEFLVKGIVRDRAIYPFDVHAARWMRRAYLATHNGKGA